MCDPISLGSLAVGALGSGINAYEKNQTQSDMVSARNNATRQEMERQKGFSQQSQQAFNGSLANFTPQAQAASLGEQQSRMGQIFQNNAPTDVGGISTASAPRIVQQGADRATGQAQARQGALGQALGNLSGYDQRTFENNVKLNDSGRNIDQIGDFAKTSAAVNGLEQSAAYRNAYRPPSGIGDLLSFAGSMGGFYGGKGGGLPFSNIFGGGSIPVNPVGAGFGRSPFGGL